MTTTRAFMKSHPVLSYFALTFAISWSGVLIVVGVGPGGIPATPEQFERLLTFVALAMLAGPSVAGVLLTGLVDGRAGLRELLSRLLRWRVGARWYALALLTAPLLFTALLLALSLLSHEFLPGIIMTDDKAPLLISSLAAALMTGFLEELGWTGFAVPRLRLRYSLFATGLIVGLLWGAWHLLVYFWGSGTSSGALYLPRFLAGQVHSFGVLVAYRVLMVWVYDRTESLPVAMLMHASLSACAFILAPLAMGVPSLISNIGLAVALWVVVAGVAVASRELFERPAAWGMSA